MADPGEAFWAFSLAFYARPGVSEACIELQDAHGADVDMVLYALWCASLGHRLDAAEIAAMDARIANWRRNVVSVVRQARRALKPAPDGFDAAAVAALRKQLLTAELEAERMQQFVMAGRAMPAGDVARREAAVANIREYSALAGIPSGEAAMTVLLDACT